MCIRDRSTIDKIIEIRLTSMADAFRIQMDDPTMKEVPFEDRFGMLVDVEYSNRKNNRLKMCIRDSWYLKNEAGTGNVVNSWFQDLDGSWYLLAPNDGHMYAGLIHDTLTDKWYYCQTEHDGYYGRMAHTDGVYTVNNQQVHLTFNQNHDGTFGAITSGLSSLQSTGVASQDVAGLPTESTGARCV